MKKTLITLATVSALAVASVGVTTEAHAQRGLAAGLFGGMVAGAIVGSAMAGPRYYYPPPPGYYAPAPVYAAPPRGCVEPQWVWSPRRGDYVMRNVRVPC